MDARRRPRQGVEQPRQAPHGHTAVLGAAGKRGLLRAGAAFRVRGYVSLFDGLEGDEEDEGVRDDVNVLRAPPDHDHFFLPRREHFELFRWGGGGGVAGERRKNVEKWETRGLGYGEGFLRQQ